MNLETLDWIKSVDEICKHQWLNWKAKYYLNHKKNQEYFMAACSRHGKSIAIRKRKGLICIWQNFEDLMNKICFSSFVHSSTVSNIEFSSDDKFFYSIGQSDGVLVSYCSYLKKVKLSLNKMKFI